MRKFGAAVCALIAPVLLGGCAAPCGLSTYCAVPGHWPLSDTFEVRRATSKICIGGTHSNTCSEKGMFQSGLRQLGVYKTSAGDDLPEPIAVIALNGSPGAQYVASCFTYSGKRLLNFAELRTGIEIRDGAGRVVALHPAHPVSRVDTIIPAC